MKAKAVLLCASVLALAPPISTAVPTVYSYTGAFYTEINDSPFVPGSYTSAMRLAGSITLADAIASSSSISIGWDSPTVLAASFDDGRFTYTKGSTPGFGGALSLSTDATGAISNWNVSVSRPDPAPGISSATARSGFICALVIEPCDFASVSSPIGAVENSFSIELGAWTITAVPEPSKYAFILAGLGLVGYAAHRRTRT
jgi:hypothetical protein